MNEALNHHKNLGYEAGKTGDTTAMNEAVKHLPAHFYLAFRAGYQSAEDDVKEAGYAVV